MQQTMTAQRAIDGDKAKGEYIRQMLTELRVIASGNDFDFLTYLIEMAVLEANYIAEGRMSAPRRETGVQQTTDHPQPEELAKMFMRGELN